MATQDTWAVDADGNFDTASNWSLGTVPTSSNDAVISTTDVHTITHSGSTDTVHALSVGSTDQFVISGGSLTILTTATFAGGYTQTGGTLTANAVSISGPGTLTGGNSEGATAFAISGTIALANYTFGGATVLNNSATTNQTGQVSVGDNTDVNATINNKSGATYNIAGDYGISQGAASATFSNAGTLIKSAGTGTSTIGINTTSAGTITVNTGTLAFSGPNNVIKGGVTGAGQIAFTGGVTSLALSSTSVATVGLYNSATLNLGASSIIKTFSDSSNGSNTLNLGNYSLTINGTSGTIIGNYGSAYVAGSGTLTNNGTLTLSAAVFGGTVKVNNAGTIIETGQVTMGDGSGKASTLTNTTKGTYNFTADNGIGQNAATIAFTNQGLLEKTAGGGTSDVSLATTNSGTISVGTGAIQFDNSLLNTGTISGAGSLIIGGGSSATLNSGTVLNVAYLDLYSTATLNLGTSLSYGGVFTDSSNGSNRLNLNSYTLTLSGASNAIAGYYGSALVTGSGTLANTGTLDLSGNGPIVFGGTVTFNNTGTAVETEQVTLGDGSGATPTITNASGAIYNFTTNSGIGQNGTNATFTNQGTLEKTGGNGTTGLSVVLNNSGTISITNGALEIDNTLNNTGTISGSGSLIAGNSGVVNLNSGTSLSAASLDVYSTATLSLGVGLTYNGVFTDSSNGSDYLNLNGYTLTLNNASDTIAAYYGTANVQGSGTLANAGTLALGGNGTIDIGGTVALSNTGTINETETVVIGDGSGQTASIVNASGGTYNLTNTAGINNGAATSSHFDNSGALRVAAGLGTSYLNTTFNNLVNGTITVSTGGLENDATLLNSGTIAGTRFATGGGGSTMLKSGDHLTVSELDLYSTAKMIIGASQTYAGSFVDSSNGSTSVVLNNTNLILTGASTFAANYGSDVVTGKGTLKLSNTSQLSGNGSLLIGGTAHLEDASTFTVGTSLQLGDSSSSAASAVVDSSGTYDLVTDAGISHGFSGASTFTNNGLFEKTAGTGTSVVSSDFVNNGTLTVSSGTVEFLAGTFTNHGTINGMVTTDSNGNTFVTHT